MAKKTTVQEVVRLLKEGIDRCRQAGGDREDIKADVCVGALSIRMPDGTEFVVHVKHRFVQDE